MKTMAQCSEKVAKTANKAQDGKCIYTKLEEEEGIKVTLSKNQCD